MFGVVDKGALFARELGNDGLEKEALEEGFTGTRSAENGDVTGCCAQGKLISEEGKARASELEATMNVGGGGPLSTAVMTLDDGGSLPEQSGDGK